MKSSLGTLLPLGILLNCGAILAQDTSSGVMIPPNYDSFIPPAVGQNTPDPAFGTAVTRVSNALATSNSDRGGSLTWIQNEYSTASAFNNDNSRFILLHESYFALYDGGTGLYIADLPLQINASSEPRWSRSDLVTIYYHSGNQLLSYNTSTGGTNVVHAFSQYGSISGLGEMDISRDGDHFVYVGDNRFAFVYQISTDTVYPALDMSGNPVDSVYITPNNEMLVSWIASGTSRFTGQELFDINGNFLRQISHADGHKHLTIDNDGSEVLIWTNSNDAQPIANCSNGIVKIALSTGAQTCLLQLDWSLAVHITAPDGNGSAFIDTEAPANPDPSTGGAWVPYANEILQVKLDGSGTLRWAQHRSRSIGSYVWQPKLTVSRDGTRLLYGSNYDLQNIYGYPADYADEYLIVMGSSIGATAAAATPAAAAPAPAAPVASAPPAAATTTVHYEQNNAAVQYGGSWFPNAGAFNSGGSAAMAMDAGSQATFTFTGSGVSWIGYGDPWSGTAAVYIDGVFQASVDTYSAAPNAQAVEYSNTNLPYSKHTLAIVVSGQHNTTAQASWVWIDAFNVNQ